MEQIRLYEYSDSALHCHRRWNLICIRLVLARRRSTESMDLRDSGRWDSLRGWHNHS